MLLPAPTAEQAYAYLGTDTSWSLEDATSEFESERAAQANRCRVPDAAATEWPADLVNALYRRVAHALALRSLPLGLQATVSDGGVATNNVGGTDAEVKRLEAPYRRLVVG